MAAACLLCDLPLGEMTSDFFRVVNEARRHSLGPFSPSFSIQTCLLEGLQKHLPLDAHKRVNGRLHISLTRVYDGKNVIVSQFTSREDVLQALLCACFIPGFSGILPPRFRGVRYMDGAFSDNLPVLDENTVTVSPFCGESDICPRDQSSQLFHVNWANTSIEISKQNINRFVKILFPPRADFLSKMCQQGFDDALQYLQRNNLINCNRCIAVQSTFIVSETLPQQQAQQKLKQIESNGEQEHIDAEDDYDPECVECKRHRRDAMSGNLPETVMTVIQGYLDSANKGLANWLFKHRSIKLLSLPATVPVDFLCATITKISILAPAISQQLRQLMKVLIYELNDVIQSRLRTLAKVRSDIIQFDNTRRAFFISNHKSQSRLSLLGDDDQVRLIASHNQLTDADTFEQVLKMTQENDTVVALYYMDSEEMMPKVYDVSSDDIFPIEATSNVDNYCPPRSLSESDLTHDKSTIEIPDNDLELSDISDRQIESVLSDYSETEDDHYAQQPVYETMESPQTDHLTTITVEK